MPYEDSVTYQYADKPKTIVRQTSIVYHSLKKMLDEIEQIDKKLADLPPPKEPPSYKVYLHKWAQTGNTYEEIVELFEARIAENRNERTRARLLERKSELKTEIKRLWKMAEIGG